MDQGINTNTWCLPDYEQEGWVLKTDELLLRLFMVFILCVFKAKSSWALWRSLPSYWCVRERPKHLDNVSMWKCSQQRLRKGHFDRKELEKRQKCQEAVLLKCQYFTISLQAGHRDKTFMLCFSDSLPNSGIFYKDNGTNSLYLGEEKCASSSLIAFLAKVLVTLDFFHIMSHYTHKLECNFIGLWLDLTKKAQN